MVIVKAVFKGFGFVIISPEMLPFLMIKMRI